MSDRILLVPLSEIEIPDGWNARSGAWHENPADLASDDGGFEGLKASLTIKGINDTPILLRSLHDRRYPLKYILVDGFRRMRAAKELGWAVIRATVEDMTDFEARRRNIQAQTSHERLKPADLAWAVADLKRLGGPKLTDEEIGALVGISGYYAGNLRRIMQDVDAKVTNAWRASAVRVDVAELQKLTVMPPEQHWTKWEELVLDKQTRPHHKTKATAFLRLKSHVRELGTTIGALVATHVFQPADPALDRADWIAVMKALVRLPTSPTEKELIDLADAIAAGYSQGLSGKRET